MFFPNLHPRVRVRHSYATRFSDVFYIDASTAQTIDTELKNIALVREIGHMASPSAKPEENAWLLRYLSLYGQYEISYIGLQPRCDLIPCKRHYGGHQKYSSHISWCCKEAQRILDQFTFQVMSAQSCPTICSCITAMRHLVRSYKFNVWATKQKPRGLNKKQKPGQSPYLTYSQVCDF
ncbi:MAG TPA: hypothetical protein VK462_04360 [Nitrososphaeraceae archaeon]|nr:hypothetical protein [Nitrososphaeraceae archaeon]